MDTPAHIKLQAEDAIKDLLPKKSSNRYWKEYETFIKWCNENGVSTPNEFVLLAYFKMKSQSFKSSTLWSLYSMLKTTINIKTNINIQNYPKLIAFLKRTKDEYMPKKSKTLEIEDINKFIDEAPNEIYLMIKAALIIGMCAACRRYELASLTVQNVQDRGDVIIISILDTKTNKLRTSCITKPQWIGIVRTYASLRPPGLTVGIHTFGSMPFKIASFLNLENPRDYTGHCFRRSSATVLAGHGADITTLKRHGGWKSTTVAEGYIEDSLKQKIAVANQLAGGRLSQTATASCSASCSSTSVNTVELSTENDFLHVVVLMLIR